MARINNKQLRRLFAIGKKLGVDIEILREIASEYNGGHRSLSILTETQAGEMTGMLQRLLNDRMKPAALSGDTHGQPREKHASITHKALRPDGQPWDYSPLGKWSQMDYMFDLILKLGWTLWGFRGWLKKYFHIDHEHWLSSPQRMRAIEALKQILTRKYNKETADA